MWYYPVNPMGYTQIHARILSDSWSRHCVYDYQSNPLVYDIKSQKVAETVCLIADKVFVQIVIWSTYQGDVESLAFPWVNAKQEPPVERNNRLELYPRAEEEVVDSANPLVERRLHGAPRAAPCSRG